MPEMPEIDLPGACRDVVVVAGRASEGFTFRDHVITMCA